jgi:hypothetical protein
VDDELVSIAKTAIGQEFGLSAAQAARLRGDNARALRHDAQEMRRELGLDPLDDRDRDQQGRFAAKPKPTLGESFNDLIRRTAGRAS